MRLNGLGEDRGLPHSGRVVRGTPAGSGSRGVGRKLLLVVVAFAVMAVLAVASMVRFTGQHGAAPEQMAVPAAPVRNDGNLVVPVAGVSVAQVQDSWGQARDGGARGHQGTDIMARAGTPVLAAATGRIEKLFQSAAGGTTLYVRSLDRRWTYYYAHLAGYAPGMAEGRVVRAGQAVGYVGDTGNAGAGNYHLHFGMSQMRPQDRWWGGTPIDPYPRLAAAVRQR